MKYLLYGILACVAFSCSQDLPSGMEGTIREGLEKAYFLGQRDALEGYVKIKKSSKGCWYWTQNIWNGETELIFNPSPDDCSDNK